MRSCIAATTLLLLYGCASDPVAGPPIASEAPRMPHASSG